MDSRSESAEWAQQKWSETVSRKSSRSHEEAVDAPEIAPIPHRPHPRIAQGADTRL